MTKKLVKFGKWQSDLKENGNLNPERDYYDSLNWCFNVKSANNLTAAQIASCFRMMFNGSEQLDFNTPVLYVAKQELIALAEEARDEIPF